MSDSWDQGLPTSVDGLAAEPFEPNGQRAAALPELMALVKINPALADAALREWRRRTALHDEMFADILDAVEVEGE